MLTPRFLETVSYSLDTTFGDGSARGTLTSRLANRSVVAATEDSITFLYCLQRDGTFFLTHPDPDESDDGTMGMQVLGPLYATVVRDERGWLLDDEERFDDPLRPPPADLVDPCSSIDAGL